MADDMRAPVRLDSNENPWGPGPLARVAIANFNADAARYPDSEGTALKDVLGAGLGVATDWITLGNGSCEILEMAGRAFVGAGRNGIMSQYGFGVYRAAVNWSGGGIVATPARADLGHDLAAMRRAVTPQTGLIFVGNPTNPTGNLIAAADLAAFVADIPSHVVILIDEAYIEYVPGELRGDAIALARAHHNVIVARTFSKAYGLAGLRVGYGISHPDLAARLAKVRSLYNTNALAQFAAIAAFKDREALERVAKDTHAGRDMLMDSMRALGLRVQPSAGNFFLVSVPDPAGLERKLQARNIFVRTLANYGLDGWLRITVGREDENAAIIAAMKACL